MSTEWLSPPYYTVPPPNPEYYLNGYSVDVRFSIDYGMGLAIDGDLKDPNNKFNNNPALDAQYHDPIAYAKNLVAKAEALEIDPKYHKPDGWNAMQSGLQYANIVFKTIKQIPCNRGDEQSNNLFDSWAAGTGQEYGGNPPKSADTGLHPETGQSAAPAGTVL